NNTTGSSPGEQATVPQIEAIIRRFSHLEVDSDFAMSVCRAIEQRRDATWSDELILLLSGLAVSHRDPQPGEYAISLPTHPDRANQSEDSPDGAASSMNCVRGAAARAIEAILFDQRGRLGILQAAVTSLLNDPHAAVRAAAIGLALPLYNIDRGVA